MKALIYDQWSRKEIYEFFKESDFPYYSLTFRQDVTKLVDFKRKYKLSFYYAFIYLISKAINDVDAFKVFEDNKELYICDMRYPSFTDIRKNTDNFYIVTMQSLYEDIFTFCAEASKLSKEQKTFIDLSKESEFRIDISCAPTLDITSATNERFLQDTISSVPKIIFGKYSDDGDRKILGLSIEVNHKYIDGIHIAKFADKLSELIENLEV